MPFKNDKDDFVRYDRFLKDRELPENDSGRGPESVLPDELQGLNWGALLLNIVWGIRMRVPQAWLMLVPIVQFVVPFVLLIKGNDWAWRNRKWRTIEEFRQSQDRWAYAGFALVALGIIGYFILMAWVNSVVKDYMPGAI